MTIEDGPARAPERRRPTGWIIATALLALLAAGLGIWALSAQSDADDAEKQLAAQAQRQAAGTDDAAGAVDTDTRQRYEDLKDEIGISGESVDELNAKLDEAVAGAERAEQARADAANAVDRARAELEALKAQAEVARACLSGTLGAFNAAFSSGGVQAAVAELESLSGQCRSAAP